VITVGDLDDIGLDVPGDDVPRSVTEPQPLTLPDRIEPGTAVAPELTATPRLNDGALFLTEVVADEVRVADSPEEAYPLAVRAVAIGQFQIGGALAHLSLGQRPHGKLRPARLLLGEVCAGETHPVPVVPQDPRVVARHDTIGAPPDRVKKGAELDPLVAEDVRRRRPSRPQLGKGVADDTIVVLLLEGYHLSPRATRVWSATALSTPPERRTA